MIISGKEGGIYVSGDTLLEGIPHEEVDYAIIFTGGKGPHPVTGVLTKAVVGPQDIAFAVENYLKAKVVIPVHYDLERVMEPTDVPAMVEEISRAANQPRVIIPSYHRWVEI